MKKSLWLVVLIPLMACGGGTAPAGRAGVQMGGSIQGRPLALAGTSSTLAGLPLVGRQDGTRGDASLNLPCGIATDGTNLYVADSSNNTIRQLVIATGKVTTLAGSAGFSGSADGTGTTARFHLPAGITTDGARLLVGDYTNNTVRTVD